LQGAVSLQPQSYHVCIGRLYNRLNDDYEPLHALCRFFLEQSGPSYQQGDRKMIPFLVNMSRLYELFVAEWLKKHLPEGYRLVAQERVSLGEGERLNISIDLVLYDRETEHPVAVLDTKYKAFDAPSAEDLHQIVAYAAARRCGTAVLIYPVALQHPFDACYGASDIHVRTLRFALDGDLEEAGERLLQELLPHSM
jgi:5-methylcytosine-specific restriction enzyme subunit McrC